MKPSVCASRASWTPVARTAPGSVTGLPCEPVAGGRPDDDIGWPKR